MIRPTISTFRAGWRWLRRIVHRLRDPFRLRELSEIRAQMNFWHEEERRTLQAAIAAFDRRDFAGYQRLWAAYQTVTRRRKTEVTDRLDTFRRSGRHACRFSGHRRISPAGGNSHNISVIVAECSCGKIRAKYPEKLTYWDERWIARVNQRIDCQNAKVEARDK